MGAQLADPSFTRTHTWLLFSPDNGSFSTKLGEMRTVLGELQKKNASVSSYREEADANVKSMKESLHRLEASGTGLRYMYCETNFRLCARGFGLVGLISAVQTLEQTKKKAAERPVFVKTSAHTFLPRALTVCKRCRSTVTLECIPE